MGFLNPWLLIALAGVAVPIIIHLLNRFRHRQVLWGAMELLRKAIVLRSRQIQLEDLLLLVLRCLAVGLLALAVARPTITSAGANWFGKTADVGLLIAIDGSFSMDHRPGERHGCNWLLTGRPGKGSEPVGWESPDEELDGLGTCATALEGTLPLRGLRRRPEFLEVHQMNWQPSFRRTHFPGAVLAKTPTQVGRAACVPAPVPARQDIHVSGHLVGYRRTTDPACQGLVHPQRVAVERVPARRL